MCPPHLFPLLTPSFCLLLCVRDCCCGRSCFSRPVPGKDDLPGEVRTYSLRSAAGGGSYCIHTHYIHTYVCLFCFPSLACESCDEAVLLQNRVEHLVLHHPPPIRPGHRARPKQGVFVLCSPTLLEAQQYVGCRWVRGGPVLGWYFFCITGRQRTNSYQLETSGSTRRAGNAYSMMKS